MATHQTTPLELDHGDQGPRIIASMVVLIVLPTIFVGARFTSRALARAGFWVSVTIRLCLPIVDSHGQLDDLFIAIALVGGLDVSQWAVLSRNRLLRMDLALCCFMVSQCRPLREPSLTIAGVRHDGLGKHIYDLQPKNATDVIKGLYAYTILYCLAVTAVKLAM